MRITRKNANIAGVAKKRKAKAKTQDCTETAEGLFALKRCKSSIKNLAFKQILHNVERFDFGEIIQMQTIIIEQSVQQFSALNA